MHARFEVFTVMKVEGEDAGSKILWNNILRHHYMVSQCRKPWLRHAVCSWSVYWQLRVLWWQSLRLHLEGGKLIG